MDLNYKEIIFLVLKDDRSDLKWQLKWDFMLRDWKIIDFYFLYLAFMKNYSKLDFAFIAFKVGKKFPSGKFKAFLF